MVGKQVDDQAVFEVARRIRDPETRQAYLLQVCNENPAMAQRVEALLQANDEDDSFLENPPPGLTNTATIDQPILEKPGTTIGPYKLLQQIGEGGMGVVYMAEQTHPLKRRVALKIIKPGMDTKQVIARFEAERQALAMMDHPNIAKVLDAGKTESGRPYFVMELVKGVSITSFCDDHHLTPKERLELFLPVLQAVQHAHQKGVIHRDIKPSNVLVAEYDNHAVPKVIDFGVAKATSQLLTEKTMFTQYGQLIGTLEYMSPEQAKLNQMDIDTRSDIYSLGVLLYELLTGETPFDRKRLRSAAFEEMMRIIRDEEPPRPSMRLTTSALLVSVSANRSTEPRKLSVFVRGELDWIVMKAMEKERSRRYETPNAFADDLQRFLNQEVILARPASSAYRLKKFALRNRTLVAAGSMIVATLVLGFGLSTWQALVANRERLKADQASRAAIDAKERAERAEEESSRQLAISRKHEAAAEALSQELTNEKAELSRQKDELRKSHYAASMNLIPAAWQAGNLRRVTELLKEQEPAAGDEDLRGFEWHYWDRECHPEQAPRNFGRGFTGQGGYAVENVGFFSGNGLRFFSLGRESGEKDANTIVMRVVNASDGNEIARWVVPGNKSTGFTSVNDDGTRIARILKRYSAKDSTEERRASIPEVQVLDATTGKEVFSRAIAKAIKCALSRDGKRLALGFVPTSENAQEIEMKFSEIHILDLENPERKPLLLKGDDQFGVMSLIWTSDGSRLISKENVYPLEPAQSRLSIWDTTTGERRATLLTKDHFITSIALSPDGSRLAGIGRSGPMFLMGSNNIFSWGGLADDEFKLLRQDRLKEGGLAINASRILFHPDNQRILIWGDPSGTKLFDTTSGKTLHKYKSSTIFNAAKFSADGSRLITVGCEKVGSLKGVPGAELPVEELLLQEWAVPLTATEELRSSKVPPKQIVWSRSRTRYAEFASSQLVAIKKSQSTDDRHQIIVCDTDGKEVLNFREHSQPILALKFSFDDRYICSQAGNRYPTETMVWEAATGNVVWSRTLPIDSKQRMNQVVFSFDGKLVALPEGGETRIVATADWKTKCAIAEGHCLSFSRDSQRFLTTTVLGENEDQTQTGEWKLYDIQTGSIIKTFPKSTARGLSADGHWIATIDVNAQEIHVWDTEAEAIKSTIPGISSRVVFNPDGTRIVVTSKFGTPEVWDLARNKRLFRLEGVEIRNLPRKGIAFSPDGKRIATAMTAEGRGTDSTMMGTVTIWEATSGRELLNLSCPWAVVSEEIEFSPDGFHLTARGGSFIENLVPGATSEKTWDATPRERSVKP